MSRVIPCDAKTERAVGQRIRKIWEHSGIIEERIYLGGFELYRRHVSGDVVLERETLYIMDDQQRIAMVETKTIDEAADPFTITPRIRYQLGNHLGSAMLELDHEGLVISYEEYHPYGTSAYRAVDDSIEVSAKRYRYTGKERDEETGLYYHGARYYACWLARWTSADPAGMVDGPNLFAYVRGRPVHVIDSSGNEGTSTTDPPDGVIPESLKHKFLHVRDTLMKMGLPDDFMRVNAVLYTRLPGQGGLAHRVGGVDRIGVTASTWARATSPDSLLRNSKEIESKRQGVQVIAHESIHTLFRQFAELKQDKLPADRLAERASRFAILEKLERETRERVVSRFASGALKRLDGGGAIATGITKELLASQGAHWIGTYYEFAQKLANATQHGGVSQLMLEYDVAMAEKQRGYYAVLPGKYNQAHGVTMTDEQFKAYREALLPGVTGNAGNDFQRILNSKWAIDNISPESRSMLLEQLEQAKTKRSTQ